jgi:hypothetical protein
MHMRQISLAALAAAAILAAGLPLGRAAAMMPGAPSARGLAADLGLLQRAVNVCGSNGCVKVETHRVVKRHPPPPLPHH